MNDNPKEKIVAANRAEAARRLAALDQTRLAMSRLESTQQDRDRSQEHDQRDRNRRDRSLEAEQ
jgi:hypothetical protein